MWTSQLTPVSVGGWLSGVLEPVCVCARSNECYVYIYWHVQRGQHIRKYIAVCTDVEITSGGDNQVVLRV